MINRTEEEIIENWKNSNIVVTISCVAYNHEYCISQALDSFLMQETEFAFEIIIHDDVSTDKTVDIIKEYQKKFPNIIKPIYQTENQFSQGINPMFFILPKVKGRYMAFCDGDDFWTDNKKLEIQVDIMEKNPNIDMSFHSVYEFINGKKRRVLAKHADSNKIFRPNEIILGGGEFCPTASLIFRTEIISKIPKDWFKKMIPGDYPLQMIGSSRGGALYINRCMSAYRVGEASAWSNLNFENSQKQKKHLLSFHKMLNRVNRYLDNRFDKEIKEIIYSSSLAFIKRRAIDISIRDEIFNRYRDIFSKKQKILWYLLYRNQDLHNSLAKIKNMEFLK